MEVNSKERCWITEKPIRTAELEDAMDDPSCGGFVSFVGKVRNHHEGKAVTGITYEAYQDMAEKAFKEIEREALERFGVQQITIVHRVGFLEVGEAAVYVGASSGHRKEAFEATIYCIAELKKRAPIWKKEHYPDGTTQWLGQCNHGNPTVTV